MLLSKSFTENNRLRQGSVPGMPLQGKVLVNCISNPTTNLTGSGSNDSSYKNFLKQLERTDSKSAEHLAGETAIEMWKKQTKRGKYEGPDVLNNMVAAHWMGLPEKQDELEEYFNKLQDTDIDRFKKQHSEFSYFFDIAKKGIYGPNGFLAGGPFPQNSYDQGTEQISIHDPFPVAVKSEEKKLLEILKENKPTIGNKKREEFADYASFSMVVF